MIARFAKRCGRIVLIAARVVFFWATIDLVMLMFGGMAWFAVHPDQQFLPPLQQKLFVIVGAVWIALMPLEFDWQKIRSWFPRRSTSC